MAPQIDLMVKIGAMPEDVGRNHPDRNTLTSAITGDAICEVDCPSRPVTLLPDDIVIVASDGLQFLPNLKITQTLKLSQNNRAVDIANALLSAVTLLGDAEQDNTAFAVIKMDARQQGAPSKEQAIAVPPKDDTMPKKRIVKIVTTDRPTPQDLPEQGLSFRRRRQQNLKNG
jgi:serine/threonine protein phosphatase PrpC